jgi:flagellar P-ring protein precursor FlgI
MKIQTVISFTFALAALGFAQGAGGSGSTQGAETGKTGTAQGEQTGAKTPLKPDPSIELKRQEAGRIREIGEKGVYVRIKDIARFRGIRSNQLLGYGLIVGLEGTGDTKSTPFTQTLLANAMKGMGTMVDPNQLKVKNVAVVAITAELPPFASPGNTIDVTVQSIGDAKSLQGGSLLQAPLYAASSKETVYAVAQGAISIGGFQAGSGGSSVQKNQLNVGRVPGGAIVENGAPTKFVFDQKMFIELDEPDLTTAQRIATELSKSFPEFTVEPLNGGTIQIDVPAGTPPVSAMSRIEMTKVFADMPTTVVINERTGTIVVGGNIKLGPAMVAKGSLTVRIDSIPFVSQPAPLSGGQTVTGAATVVNATEETASIALMGETATVADLARIFQALKLSPSDIISILQALRDQGALKARIKIQ